MTSDQIKSNLAAIRECVDVDPSGTDMESVLELGKKLSSLMGLSAECQSEAQRILKRANLIALKGIDVKQPSIAIKMMDAECADDIALYEYTCRINAAITHKLDFIRTVISLHKTELEKGIN